MIGKETLDLLFHSNSKVVQVVLENYFVIQGFRYNCFPSLIGGMAMVELSLVEILKPHCLGVVTFPLLGRISSTGSSHGDAEVLEMTTQKGKLDTCWQRQSNCASSFPEKTAEVT